MPEKLYKVGYMNTKEKYAIVADSLEQLCVKFKKKLNIDTNKEVLVCLEDGTEIDSESFPFLEKDSVLIISLKDEADFARTIDFTKLAPTMTISKGLTCTSPRLRKDMYILWANSEDVCSIFERLLVQITTSCQKKVISFERAIPERDIMYCLLNDMTDISVDATRAFETKIVSVHLLTRFDPLDVQLLPPRDYVNKRNCFSTVTKSVGYQHIYMHHNTLDSASTDTTDDSIYYQGTPPKRKKTCQLLRDINYEGQLAVHKKNATIIKGPVVRVDILIYCSPLLEKYLGTVSKFLGLIVLDELLKEAKINANLDLMLNDRLSNPDAKTWRLLQGYINRDLMFGNSNICLTNNYSIFDSVYANVKGVIYCESEEKGPLEIYLNMANYEVKINDSVLEFIVGITEILNTSINFSAHVDICFTNIKDKINHKVKLPLASMVPLYILRLLAQKNSRKLGRVNPI